MSSTANGAEIDALELRRVMGSYPTGVTVVTTRDRQGALWGLTANSFTSLSLRPPLVLVCIDVSTRSYAAFAESGSFAVSILADDQRTVSQIFASARFDKFDSVSWWEGRAGNPIVSGAAAWLECAVHRRLHEGDHMILIGRIDSLSRSDRQPLGYHSGGYVRLSPHDACRAATVAG